MQEELIAALLAIFSSEDGDNRDLCLKMSCLDFIKNFFNSSSTTFQTDTY